MRLQSVNHGCQTVAHGVIIFGHTKDYWSRPTRVGRGGVRIISGWQKCTNLVLANRQ